MAVSNPARPGIFYGWFVVATCMFIAFVTMGARNSFGAFVVPMEAEFEWNRTVVSWAAALGALLNGVTQPFMGYLFDRFGVRIVVVAGILVVGVSTLLMAATSSIWYMIAMFGVVAAIGQSGSSMTNTAAMLSKWFRRRRGLVIGLNASGMSLGSLVLVPFAAFLISLIDWRLSWIILGGMILVLGIPLALIFLHDDPAKKGLTPDGDPVPEEASPGSAGEPPPPPQPLFAENWRQAFKSWPIWQMSFSYYICGSTTFMLAVHFVPMAIEEGVNPQTAALIFGLMSGLNALGATGAGWISDRIGGRKNWLTAVYFCRGTGYVILVASLVTPGFPVMAGLAHLRGGRRVVVDCNGSADLLAHRRSLRTEVHGNHFGRGLPVPPTWGLHQRAAGRLPARDHRRLHRGVFHRGGDAVSGGHQRVHHTGAQVLGALPHRAGAGRSGGRLMGRMR